MDTAKELLAFKLQNEEVRMQNLVNKIEQYFSQDAAERLQDASQQIYLQFRLQKIYEICSDEFDLKKEILFPAFRKYFPKREKELSVLFRQMEELKKNLYALIQLLYQLAKGTDLKKTNKELTKKIMHEGQRLIPQMHEYFQIEDNLIHQELFSELREDEAEVFFRKIVERQKRKLMEVEAKNLINKAAS